MRPNHSFISPRGCKVLAAAVLLICGLLMGRQFIINFFAFFPDRSDLIPVNELPAGVEEVFVPTPDGVQLQCYWLPSPHSQWVLVYFHGNAGNIGQRLPELESLSGMGINVLGVSYRGYGKSSGRPSEAGLYEDGRSALNHVTVTLGFQRNRVILLGRSIGGSVAVETGKGSPMGGFILVTPFTDGQSMARRSGIGFLARLAGNPFDNLSKIDLLRAPLLIVHGTDDAVVPFAMGWELYERAPHPKQFVKLQGCGHNDISLEHTAGYRTAVKRFIASLKST